MKKVGLFFLLLLVVFGSVALHTKATDTEENNHYYCADIRRFREEGNYTAPTCSDKSKVFVGWYYDAEYTMPLDETVTHVEEGAYAKFVDKKMLNVKFQLKKGTTTLSETTNFRIITAIDSTNYSYVGFEVIKDGKSEIISIVNHTVWTTLYGYQNEHNVPYTPADTFGTEDATYFATIRFDGFDHTRFFNALFEVTPRLVTWDGTTVEGTTRAVKIKEGATVAEVAVIDDSYGDTNVRFKTNDVDTLPYATDLSSALADKKYQYKALEGKGGVYINGSEQPDPNIILTKYGKQSYMIYWGNSGNPELTPGMTVKIDGQFGNDTQSMKLGPVTFVYEGPQTHNWGMYNLEVNVHSYGDVGSYPYNELRMVPDVYDELNGWYTPLWGGVTVDGQKLDYDILRHPENGIGYYAYTKYSATPVKEGSKAVVDCIIGTAEYGVRICEETFVYAKTSDCKDDQCEWISQDASLSIVEDGATEYVIVRGANASASEVTASKELQSYLKEITGATLPIVTDATTPVVKEIVVGKTNRETSGAFDRASLGDDGYVIKISNKKLWIVGGEQRGTLYGVYAYLEDYLGCRFYTADAEKVPQKANIIMPNDYNETYIPQFELRDITYPEYGGDDISVKRNYNSNLWGRELSQTVGGGINFTHGIGGHTFFSFVDPAVYYDTGTHKEYFSYIPGEGYVKNGQLCLTNPEVIDLIIEGAKKWLEECKDKPEQQRVHVSQNDTQRYCQCDNCMKFYNEHGGAYSSTIINVVNEVAKAIRTDYPDAKVITYAYQYSRSAPANMTLEDNVIIELCAIEGCFSHGHANYADGTTCAPAANAHASYTDGRYNTFENDLKAWSTFCQQNGNKLYVYDYTFNVWHSSLIFPDLDCLRENVALYAKYGVSGLRYEGVSISKTPEFGALRGYLLSKLMKNPTMSEEEYYAHMDDFLIGVYGPGGSYIRKYIDKALELVKDIHFNLTPHPEELYPTTVVQNHTTTEFPSELTAQQLVNYTSTDWSKYWNWCTDVIESPLTSEGEKWFEQALALAETDAQRERIQETYIQVQYLKSYYLKRKIEAGQDTFTDMLQNYINAQEGYNGAAANTITNWALAQLYKEYIAYNKELVRAMVQQGYEQYRPTYALNNWQNYNFANTPLEWPSWNRTQLDIASGHAEATLWVKTDSVDTFAADTSWREVYWAYEGGVYVNGEKTNMHLTKLYGPNGTEGNQYILRIHDIMELTVGTYVTIDGVFGDGDKVIRFNQATFVYTAANTWEEATHMAITGTGEGTTLKFTMEDGSMNISSKEFQAVVGGVYVNEETTPRSGVTLSKGFLSSEYEVKGIAGVEGMRVTIDGIFKASSQVIRIQKATFVYKDGVWRRCFAINSYERTDVALWFNTEEADKAPAGTYEEISGGIYINGELRTELYLYKHAANGYYIYVQTFGKPTDGMVLLIDGMFGNGENTFYIGPVTFRFDASLGKHGTWVQQD